MQKTFDTPGPISLYVELGSGDVTVRAAEVTTTEVTVSGKGADEVVVEQDRNQVSVVQPRQTGFLSGSSDLTVTVTLPLDSDLTTKLGSADLVASGRYGAARIKSGSGDVQVDDLTADAVIQTGSGDIELDSSLGDLRIKSGSGDVHVGRLAASTVVSTGSGDVTLEAAEDRAVVKSGSGDVVVRQAHTDLSLTSASGDLQVDVVHRGSLQAKAVSGDVRIGVPPAIPVWTDVSCVSGAVHTDLTGAGRPEKDQDYIELRVSTVSGDITLAQL